MPRTIWTKLQSDPNGSWTRHEGEPPFSIPATGGLAYDLITDTGENFTITPLVAASAPVINGQPTLSGLAEVGQTLVANAAPSSGTAPITTSWQWLRNGTEISGATAGTIALTSLDEGDAVSVRQTDSNAQGSDSATSASVTVAPASSGDVAAISGLLVTDQSATGEVVLAYSIDRDSAVSGVLTRSASAPSATHVLAGQDQTGAPAASSFSDVWTTAGNDTLPSIASGLASDTYYLHVLAAGGGDADVVSSNGFRLETVRPQVTAAQSSATGLQIDLTFSEDLMGTTSAPDWTLTANGAAWPIAGATFTANQLSLTLSTPVTAGQALLLSYAGSGLTDDVANQVAAFTEFPVSNIVTGSFAENSVTVPLGSYLTANDPLPQDARALLFFASLTQDAGLDARAVLATWAGTAGGIYSDYNAGNGMGGARIRFQDGTANLLQGNETIPLGTRYHLLVSSWIDPTDVMNAQAWVFDTTIGSWAEIINATDTSAPDSTFDLGPDPLRLLCRSDGTNHTFAGTLHRIALWSGSGAAPLTDISQPSVRDIFAGPDGIEDPALSLTSLGQPLVDFAGDAAAYNSGNHSGSLGAFTVSGTFS